MSEQPQMPTLGTDDMPLGPAAGDAGTASANNSQQATPLPMALPVEHGRWLWIVPVAAVLFALWITWQAWRERGVLVTVTFQEGHGLVAGDAVKYRGIAVGSVRDVRLAADTRSVRVLLALRPDASELAREGTRFWLVRPEVGLQRVSGLDTIIGARYVGLWPGDGPPSREFVGLDQAPITGLRQPGDISIVIAAPRRGSISVGSPLTFRQMEIGSVESIQLAPDATAVEIAVLVEAPFVHLIRENSVFWDAGGIEVGFGLKGLTAAVESPTALLRGGISTAAPNNPGRQVSDGHRFTMAEKFEDSWLKWKPVMR